MKSLQHSTLLLLSVLVSLLPAAAQAPTYKVIAADVPFQFTAGERTFRPGHYEFILVGTGLMAIRDHHKHLVAALIIRSSDETKPSPGPRLVFDRSKKKPRLEKIYLENPSRVLEVVGEQLATPSTPPPAPLRPPGTFSFPQRTDGVRLIP